MAAPEFLGFARWNQVTLEAFDAMWHSIVAPALEIGEKMQLKLRCGVTPSNPFYIVRGEITCDILASARAMRDIYQRNSKS